MSKFRLKHRSAKLHFEPRLPTMATASSGLHALAYSATYTTLQTQNKLRKPLDSDHFDRSPPLFKVHPEARSTRLAPTTAGTPLLGSPINIDQLHLEPRSNSLASAISGMPLLTSLGTLQAIHSFSNLARPPRFYWRGHTCTCVALPPFVSAGLSIDPWLASAYKHNLKTQAKFRKTLTETVSIASLR